MWNEYILFTGNNDIGGRDISRYITSHVEASNIGRKIADEVIDEQRRSLDSPLTNTSTPSPSHLQTLADVCDFTTIKICLLLRI